MILGGHRGLGCTDHTNYSHRDLNSLPVENTLESLTSAFKLGASYVELDAVMSSDSILFTIHNVVPKDHFFGTSMPADMLNRLRFQDIQQFKTGRLEKGQIDTLLDTLNAIANSDPRTADWAVNIEIKGVQGSGQDWDGEDFIKNLAETAKKSHLPQGRILWSSFCLKNITAISHLVDDGKFGMLFPEKGADKNIYSNYQDDKNFRYLPFIQDNIDFVLNEWASHADTRKKLEYLHPEIGTISDDILSYASNAKLGINCWALFEKIDDERLQHYKSLDEKTKQENIPFTIITDYLKDFSPK